MSTFPTPSVPASSTVPAYSEGHTSRVDDTWVGNGPKVAILGDSLTASNSLEMIRTLPDLSLKFVAFTGEGFAGGPLSTGFNRDSVLYDGAVAISIQDQPDVVVIALGTNDAWTPAVSASSAITELDRIVALFPESCIVATTIRELVPEQVDYDMLKARALNERLLAVADEVIDWNAAVVADPGLVGSDGIHLSPAGHEQRAALTTIAVAKCLQPTDTEA